MFQKCDRCDRPAVVRETILKQGVHKEVYFCEEHAKEAGIAMPGHMPTKQILTQLLVPQAESARVLKRSCSTCGLTFAQFRQGGTLGCPACYEAFHGHLASLIERAQNGGTQHIGKVPRRVGPTIDRQLRIQRLAKELDDAVVAEEYERAAKLRDSLKDLQPEASRSDQDDEARTTGS